MAKREELKVKKRSVLGKKVKKLRKEGILPANIYGRDMKSSAVELPLDSFLSVFSKVHETGLVDLAYDGQTIPVLIHNVQIDPRTQTPVHADFFKVNLKEKIKAHIPIVAVGEPKAVADKTGLLEQPVSELEVEALPTDLPEKIEVNVEQLTKVDDQIIVSDIKVADEITILSDQSQVVFKIGELVTKEMEAEIAAEEAETAAAVAEAQTETETPAEGAEGEKPAEGDGPKEGADKQESDEKPAEGDGPKE